ncbi:MAG: TadE/TadG family type IV pilus assembly protein [Pyrinomonadaceae bacterium]
MRRTKTTTGESGIALLEFAIGALIFFTMMFGVIEFSRLLWTHNTLVDATRRGARFAVMNSQDADAVKEMVVYGMTNPPKPVAFNLTTDDVEVDYSTTPNFGVKQGTVSVKITGYQFNFVVPLLLGAPLPLPEYHTTLTGESAGYIPGPPATPTPAPSPGPSPTPSPTPGPSPTPTPTPIPTPTPTPTPLPACTAGQRPAQNNCTCNPPMVIGTGGRCQNPAPTPTPTPVPTPTPTPTPTPSPTPLPNCTSGRRPGNPPVCVCQPPMVVNPNNGRCQ